MCEKMCGINGCMVISNLVISLVPFKASCIQSSFRNNFTPMLKGASRIQTRKELDSNTSWAQSLCLHYIESCTTHRYLGTTTLTKWAIQAHSGGRTTTTHQLIYASENWEKIYIQCGPSMMTHRKILWEPSLDMASYCALLKGTLGNWSGFVKFCSNM